MHMAMSTELGPLPDEYASLAEDVMRIAAMHAAIQVMLVCEGRGTRLFDRRAASILMYSLLGLAMYHLVIRRLVVIRRRDEKAPHDSVTG